MTGSDFFSIAGSIAGLAGLSIALVLIIFRDVIRKNIFPRLSKVQAFNLIRLITILVTIIAMVGIAAWLINGMIKPQIISTTPTTPNPKVLRAITAGVGEVSASKCPIDDKCGPIPSGSKLHVDLDRDGYATLFMQDNGSLFHPMQELAFIRNMRKGDLVLDTHSLGSDFNCFYIVTSAKDFATVSKAERYSELPEGERWGPVYLEMRENIDTSIDPPSQVIFDTIKLVVPADKVDAEIIIDGKPARVSGSGIAKRILISRSDKPHRIVVEKNGDSCVSTNVFIFHGSMELYPCQ